MQGVLAVYERPYGLLFPIPIVCFNERLGILRTQRVVALPPIPAQPSRDEQPARTERPRRESNTYVHQGTTCLLVASKPGISQRAAQAAPLHDGPSVALNRNRVRTKRP
jgi:hypothetical protein